MSSAAGELSNIDAEPPGFAEILIAARRLAPVAVRTPLIESELLNREAGRRVLVKVESLQRAGSFKFRGAWNHLRAVAPQDAEWGVLAISSGNHAQGVARAAWLLGYPATIVMPADAPAPKLSGVRAYGASIVSYDRARESRDAVAAEALAKEPRHLVRPYDDPLVIAGQGTIGLEIAEDAGRLGVRTAEVLTPTSGGGLASGVAIALATEAPEMQVRTVEPTGFDDWARSLAAGERLANESSAGSLCDALLAETPGRITWAAAAGRLGVGIRVDDAAAMRAVAAAWRWLRIVLEPSGAIALAAAMAPGDVSDPVIVIASGGNVAPETFAQAIGA